MSARRKTPKAPIKPVLAEVAPLPRIPVWALRAIGAVQRQGDERSAARSLAKDYKISLEHGQAAIEHTVRYDWLTAHSLELTPQAVEAIDNISEMRGPSLQFEGAPTQLLENALSATEVALLTSLDQPGPIRNDLWRREVAHVSDWISRWSQRGLVQASTSEISPSASKLHPLDLVVIADSHRAPIEALLADLHQQLDDILVLPEFRKINSSVGHSRSLPI